MLTEEQQAELARLPAEPQQSISQQLASARRHGYLEALSGGTARNLVALLNRGVAQITLWHKLYGEHNPQWLPPGGDVRWMEDVAEAIEGRAPPTKAHAEPQSDAKAQPVAQEPEFFTIFVEHDGGWIPLPGYSNETVNGVKNLVLQSARREGYKGTVDGRLLALGWRIGPVYATPPDHTAAMRQAVEALEVIAAVRNNPSANLTATIVWATADRTDEALAALRKALGEAG